MLSLSLLIVCVLFSCCALVVSLLAMRRTLEINQYRVAWTQLQRRYSDAADKFENEYNRIDGTLDRTVDRLDMLDRNFRRFRSRVTMQERRETETAEIETVVPGANEAPLTEEQKASVRLKLHNQRYGLAPATQPRDIKED